MTTATITEGGSMTVEEFLQHPDSARYELVDGVMKERALSYESAWIAGEVYFAIRAYTTKRGGTACPDGADFRCFGEEGRNARKPDASYLQPGRLDEIPRGACEVVPDLVVEVLSPDDFVFDVNEKLRVYRTAGVPVVVVISPDTRTTFVHRGDETQTLTESDTLSLDDVMPGFSLELKSVFPPAPTAGE